MNGLLLALSMASSDASAQSHHGYSEPLALEYQHNAEEYSTLVSLVQQWDDAVRYSPYGEHRADLNLQAFIEQEMAEDRAMLRGVDSRIESLEADIVQIKRELRYDSSARNQRRLSRKKSRLSDARRDRAELQAHRQQTRSLVSQLSAIQPRFERGYASGHDYRTKRSLLWQLVDAAATEPMVTSTWSYSSFSSTVEISVGSPGYGSAYTGSSTCR